MQLNIIITTTASQVNHICGVCLNQMSVVNKSYLQHLRLKHSMKRSTSYQKNVVYDLTKY